MYTQFFGLQQEPFSIAPDPRYLYMSDSHREALAHLLYGIRGGGGFVVLTGEIGAGKTTVCRGLLEQVPDTCKLAYVFNPRLSVDELLVTICEEFGLRFTTPEGKRHWPGPKECVDALNRQLLETHAAGGQSVLIIDEAQNLPTDVLEQLRLLTNLETNERKLLQIILIGQPGLRELLADPSLVQLSQRVIARFHLGALSAAETARYVAHRWEVAGGAAAGLPFDAAILRRIHRYTGGVPRRINLLCDRALLAAYAAGARRIDARLLHQAALEVSPRANRLGWLPMAIAGLAGLALLVALLVWIWPYEHDTTFHVATHDLAPLDFDLSGLAAETAPFTGGGPEIQAWQALAGLWKLDGFTGDPCGPAVEAQGLVCYRGRGGLGEIRQMGRPVVLTLQADPRGPRTYALLIGLDAQRARFDVGGVVRNVPLMAVAPLWQGEYATWWRVPPGWTPRNRKVSTEWLGQQLARTDGRPQPVPLGEIGTTLRNFQRMQGLNADGVPGARTLMLLNRLGGVDEPRLAERVQP